jgi:hypothetical protein
MIKALIIEPPQLGPVGWWRLYSPLQEMRRLYRGEFDFTVSQDFSEGELMAYDWVILARPSKEKEMELIATAKKLGVNVCVDYDDDLLNLITMHPSYGNFGDPARQMVVKTAAKVADMVWTSTPSIADSLKREDAIVIPNAVPVSWLPDKPAPITKSAAWRGREQQYVDVVLQSWASGWYDQIKDLPDSWTWLGWAPFPIPNNGKHRMIKYENIIKYWDHIRTAGTNIIWKPLLECTFNNGKSNIAWLEATVGGGVCVTNYAGTGEWLHCLPDFDFNQKVIFSKWEESRAAVEKDYNLTHMARRRFESLVQHGK